MATPKYYDNTRTSDHMTCPRKYYLRHIRDWIPDRPNKDLAFGKAWHEAMDVVWGNIALPNDHLINAAFVKFEDSWTNSGFSLLDEMDDEEIKKLSPKHPGIAFNMIVEYVDQRRAFIEGCEILSIEKPFAVPLDPTNPELFYVGRIDKVVRRDGRIYGIEHKTTGLYSKQNSPPFRSQFLDSFSPNSQIDGYLHAMRMLYGDEAKGILVDAALTHKIYNGEFAFIPMEREAAQLDAWLFEVHERIHNIERDKRNLKGFHELDEQQLESFSYLPAFPKNTNACSNYSGCSYRNICKFIPNPAYEDEPPSGYREEHWEPYSELELNKIGLGAEENGT